MFIATLRLMMGSIGRFFSQLYAEYSVYINFVVLLYGMSILWVHNNLRTVIRSMEKGIVQIAREDELPYNFKKTHNKFSQIWLNQNKGKYSFIPSRRDIWFEKVDSAELLNILNINPDYVKMALHKNLGEPAETEFPKHVYLAWDEYRHGLVRGLRKRFIDPKEVKQRLEKRNKK